MNDKMTDRAKRVMHFATLEATAANYEYIGTEHIMLGLIKEGMGVAAGVLKDLQVADRIDEAIRKAMVPLPEIVTLGSLPRTPRARAAIEKALAWTVKLGHAYIGTEHLLLGLMEVTDAVPAMIVDSLGVSPEAVTKRCLEFLGHAQFDADPPTVRGGPIRLSMIAPVLAAVIDGKWVRIVNNKLEIRDPDSGTA